MDKNINNPLVPTLPADNPLVRYSDELVGSVPAVSATPAVNKLIKKIDSLLTARLRNELRILDLIDGGLVEADGEISEVALQMHRSSKDSISDLIKIKMNLEGTATENKNVVHSFDTRSLLNAIRQAKKINDRYAPG